MDDDITIRRATAADAKALGAVHVQTWREAYTGRMPQPVLDALTPARSTARWEAALASPDSPSTTLVAVANGSVVGFATAGPDRTEADQGIELYSIYVLADHHRRGVGQRLLDAAIGDHAAALWILDDNPRADDFYRRNGFTRTSAHRLDDRFPGGRLREVRMVRTGTDPGAGLRRDTPAADAVRHASSPVDTAPVPKADASTGPVPQTRRERAHPTGPVPRVPAASVRETDAVPAANPAAAWISATPGSAPKPAAVAPDTKPAGSTMQAAAPVDAGAAKPTAPEPPTSPRAPRQQQASADAVPPTSPRSGRPSTTTRPTPAAPAGAAPAKPSPSPHAPAAKTGAAAPPVKSAPAPRTAPKPRPAAAGPTPATTAAATGTAPSRHADDAPTTAAPARSDPASPSGWQAPTGLVDRWLPFYREAHEHPELSGEEHGTTRRIERALDALGIAHLRVSDTGTVGILRNGEGPVVAFRADIDGLPVTEDTGLPFASTDTAEFEGRPVGTMHACGHDTHFTSALAAADHLTKHRDDWAGTLVLVFQPAEETAAGAAAMLDGGLWERAPKPDVVLGQHVMPLPAGVVALRAGSQMSLADTLRVTVRGKQAHGSQPEASVDPIVAAAAAVMRLQTVVARETPPGAGVVVTVGTFHAGTAANVIPAEAEFTVNIRTPDEPTRESTLEAVRRIVRAEADASRADVDIEQVTRFPRCVNDAEHTARVSALLGDALGDRHVLTLDRPLAGSEDVGALADALGVPMVYWFFGGFPEAAFADGAGPAGNHSPHFAPDARLALTTGITAAVAVLRSYLAPDPAA